MTINHTTITYLMSDALQTAKKKKKFIYIYISP